MDAELVRARGEVHRVLGRVGARARDDGRAISDLVDRRLVQREALVVGERRRLARRPRHDEAVGAVRDEVCGERCETLWMSTDPSGLNGVQIAVRISPSTS